MVEDTGPPKKDARSVGATPQYAATLSENANCQTFVSLTLARDEVSVTGGQRLFRPEVWAADSDRMPWVGALGKTCVFRGQRRSSPWPRSTVSGPMTRFGCMLVDANYSSSA